MPDVLNSVDLPVGIFGGYNSSMPPAGLPEGASPLNQDVEYPEGSVRTRRGIQSFFASLASNTIGGLKTYITPSFVDRLLVWSEAGNLYKENPVGTLALAASGGIPGLLYQSFTIFGREYQAFFNSIGGADIPRQFDDTNWDRVSQVGPGAAPTIADFLPSAASISNPASAPPLTIAAAPTGAVRSGSKTFVFGHGDHQVEVTLSTTVTISTTVNHGFAVEDSVQIAEVADSTFDGTFIIATVPSSTTFTYSQYGSLDATSGSGTAMVPAAAIVRGGNTVTVTTAAAHGFQVGWTVLIAGVTNIALPGSIYSVNGINGVVTVEMIVAHHLVVGATVVVTSSSDPTYNGTFLVATVPSATGFTYIQATTTNNPTGSVISTTFNGTFVVRSVPSSTTFTYAQIGPDQAQNNAGATATIAGNVTAGLHQFSVSFITRQGYITKPAPPVSFSAAGGKLVTVTAIPTGPSNVIGRLLVSTPLIVPPATAGAFYSIPTVMQINDNTATSAVIDFSDPALIAGFSAEYLFGQVELGESSFVSGYNDRVGWLGERNKIPNAVNLTFDGGWNLGAGVGGSDVPLGWTSDATYGAGASQETLAANIAWGSALRITGDGVSANRGMITQGFFQDYLGVNVLNPNTAYSFRVRLVQSGLSQGNFAIEVFSPGNGSLGLATVASSLITGTIQEFTGSLLTAQTTIPADTLLRVYGSGVLHSGGYFTADSIEIYPTLAPFNSSSVRVSYVDNPESYDSVTGLITIRPDDGQMLRGAFQIRNNWYFGKDHYLAYVTDDGINEPASWTVNEISSTVGICGPNAWDASEEWAVFAERSGLYILTGAEPIKIMQEIQEDASGSGKVVWNSINWAAATTIWVRIDEVRKRILVGAPVNGATTPNVIFVMDYKFLASADYISASPGVVYSIFTGRLLSHGAARKWTVWNIAAASACFSERPDGTAQLFLGNSVGNGEVYEMLDSLTFDGSGPIASLYQFYAAPDSSSEGMLQLRSHRKLHTYLTGRIVGQATLPGAVQSMTYNVGSQQVTVLMSKAHGLAPGQWVVTSLASDAAYNGWGKVLTVPNQYAFTYFRAATSLPSATGASVSGTLNVTAITEARSVKLRGISLSTAPSGDFERPLNIHAERVIYQFDTSVPGSWFQIEKLVPVMLPDPTMPVRGSGGP